MPTDTWRTIAARMRGELDRADIPGRAKRLAEVVIKATLMRGRTRVVIPDREGLCGVLGIGKGHIAGVFLTLEEARIVTCKAVADGWELLVFADASGWQVDRYYEREQLAAYLAMLERAPGQVQGELIEPEPSLARAHAEVSAQATLTPVTKKGTASYQKGNCELPKRELPVRNNSKQLTVHGVTALKQLSSEQLTAEREREVMDKLRDLVGHQDVDQWGGDWRKNWLRRHPRAFQAALDTLLEERKTGWRAKCSPGAALKDLTRRYAHA